MDDPRYDPAPPDRLERIHTLARDLAYGASINEWPAEFYVHRALGDRVELEHWDVPSAVEHPLLTFSNYIVMKWAREQELPQSSVLAAFGYFETLLVSEQDHLRYRLTEKAFSLLTKPARAPKVFIAYNRAESTAFALLIEAKLQIHEITAFIDIQIEPGADWEERIQTLISDQVDYFVCVLSPRTLKRPVIQKEIRWALEAQQSRGVWLIPMWHNGFTDQHSTVRTSEQDIKGFVTRKNAIHIVGERPQEYQSAISLLLNQLRFR